MFPSSSLPTSARPPRAARLAICPPAAARGVRPWLQRLRDWLKAGWSAARSAPGSEPLRVLAGARQEFLDGLDDIEGAAAEELRDRIHFARSLRELWHLRAQLFSLVSLHHDQHEADARLAALNRHFPKRAARSDFGALNTAAPNAKSMWP